MSEDPQVEEIDDSKLRHVIEGFLSKYEFLHEYRLQKLIYMADLLSIEEKDNRITEADFMPFMYGSYSEDIAEILESLEEKEEIGTKADMHHGKVTTAYFDEAIDDDKISPEIKELIDRVHKVTKSRSNDDLANWSKETWLYENTPYAEKMDFEEYKRKVDSGHVQSDLKGEFSPLT